LNAFIASGFVFLSAIANQGSARILATSRTIVCTALVASDGAPPVSMVSLPVIEKTKQHGD
jgi:hypothetical protein